MTTATKPRIKRARKGSKGKTTMKPTKAITAYDSIKAALAVQHQDETGYQVEPEYHQRIAFVNPRVVVTMGTRDGCVLSGFLGYVEGDIKPSQDVMIPFNDAQAIRWNGEQFTDDTGQHIEAMSEVFIIGKTMLGVGLQYGTVKAVSAVTFNPDAAGRVRNERNAEYAARQAASNGPKYF